MLCSGFCEEEGKGEAGGESWEQNPRPRLSVCAGGFFREVRDDAGVEARARCFLGMSLMEEIEWVW